MQEFITLAMSQLGTSEAATKAATGGVLGFLSQNAPAGDVSELMAKLPGAEQLMKAAPETAAAAGAGGGMLGSLISKASSALGGGGAAAGLLGTLQSAGLDAGKAGTFVSMFVSFAREKAGADLVNRITSNVPALAAMIK
jgi:Protein of unknown function VcgC/VcgE (DUF2780)